MATNVKDPVLVVLQLSGGNDYFNTVIPYTDPNYHDSRRTLGVPEDKVLRLDDELGFHPAMGPMKEMYDGGNVAIVHGVGYENSSRSHFRSMDIWHTCEPVKAGTEGWVGRAIRDLDPRGESPVTAVNIGVGLPKAVVAPGVSVASVADLATYGFLGQDQWQQQRVEMLDRFARMYGPATGTGPVLEYVGQSGLDALNGADILKDAGARYSSEVEYAGDKIARSLRDVATIHTSGVGTRIFYTQHGGFDTHAGQAADHPRLWTEVSGAVRDFWDDLRAHDADDNVIMLIFSEFGRRVKDNGSGTDHGSAGVSFVVGPQVKGGMYGVYPDTNAGALDQGDLVPNQDFRGVYSTILQQWLGLDPVSIVNGQFEQPQFVEKVAGSV